MAKINGENGDFFSPFSPFRHGLMAKIEKKNANGNEPPYVQYNVQYYLLYLQNYDVLK